MALQTSQLYLLPVASCASLHVPIALEILEKPILKVTSSMIWLLSALAWDALPLLPVTLTWVISLPGKTFLAVSKLLCSGPQSALSIHLSQST